MRIISGTLRRRQLATPDFEGVRPTSDRLRETLFNILAPRVEGATVLDGFAGTGALGIEALSRGAAHATFVDADRRALALVAENIRRCGVAERCAIIRGGLIETSAGLEHAPFDLVLLDPPYTCDTEEMSDVLRAVSRALGAGGLVVLEHARRREAPPEAGELRRTRTVTSGDSVLSFYQRSDSRRADREQHA